MNIPDYKVIDWIDKSKINLYLVIINSKYICIRLYTI